MMVYAGSVASLDGIRRMKEFGVGRLVAATGWKNPVPGLPWCFDNGTIHAHRRGQPFPDEAFWKLLCDDMGEAGKIDLGVWAGSDRGEARKQEGIVMWPRFGVCPDKYAGGHDSLDFSVGYRERLRNDINWYLVVQDGMRESKVQEALDWCVEESRPFGGLFVGGTPAWKRRTTPNWVRFARHQTMWDEPCALPVHVGGIGNERDLLWLKHIGVASADATSFRRVKNLRRALALEQQQQLVTC